MAFSWLFFIMEMGCVHSEAGTYALNTIQMNFMFKIGRVMGQPASRQFKAAKFRIRSLSIPCAVCGGRSGRGTWFSASTLGFPGFIIPAMFRTHFSLHGRPTFTIKVKQRSLEAFKETIFFWNSGSKGQKSTLLLMFQSVNGQTFRP
jgi:hypothetical protein